MKRKEKTLKNFIKNFTIKNLYIFIGKIVTFLIIEIAMCNIGLYIINNCITTIK